MKKPLTGKKWFFAQGQSAAALGCPWHLVKSKFNLYSLPRWAQQALAAGHISSMPQQKFN
jgi:hypothetical protein